MKYYSLVGDSDFLAHHGIKGMHWGIRRYQNYDGTRIGSSPRVVYGTPGLPSPSSLAANSSGPRHTGKNPRRQSIKNTIRGTVSGHYLRNKLNKNLPQNEKEALERGWRKLSDKDSSMHQFHQEDGVKNSKWVSKDGHREVVFTGKGDNQHITTDPRDQGTYNVFDPKKNPIGHAVLDVIPYMVLGNSADDSTTMYDRAFESVKNFMDKTTDTLDDLSIMNGEEFCKEHKIAV